MLKVIKLKGSSVEDGGAKREVEFYNGFDVLSDEGRELFSFRLLSDGRLEISALLNTVRHGDKRFNGELIVRPQGTGRIIVSRDEYRER